MEASGRCLKKMSAASSAADKFGKSLVHGSEEQSAACGVTSLSTYRPCLKCGAHKDRVALKRARGVCLSDMRRAVLPVSRGWYQSSKSISDNLGCGEGPEKEKRQKDSEQTFKLACTGHSLSARHCFTLWSHLNKQAMPFPLKQQEKVGGDESITRKECGREGLEGHFSGFGKLLEELGPE